MPTREHSAPTIAWSSRHCPQDCAPAALATLVPIPRPPGMASALRNNRGKGLPFDSAALSFKHTMLAKCVCPTCRDEVEYDLNDSGTVVNCSSCNNPLQLPPMVLIAPPVNTASANRNLRPCKDCGNQLSKNADFCPHCGAKIKRTSFLALLGAAIGAIFLIGFIASVITESSPSPQRRSPLQTDASPASQPSQHLSTTISEQSLQALDFDTTYYGVVNALGPPDKEISTTDVPLPNIVMGYRDPGWLVYVVYDIGDRTFDKGKTHYLGTITTERVVHASNDKYRQILEGLKDGLKQP